jgi:hypothetical protein
MREPIPFPILASGSLRKGVLFPSPPGTFSERYIYRPLAVHEKKQGIGDDFGIWTEFLLCKSRDNANNCTGERSVN